MRTIPVRDGQTLSDITIQETGDIHRVFEVAQLNGMSITDELTVGSLITVPDPAFDKLHVVAAFATQRHKPASALTAEDHAEIKGGIDYMGIQIDFKVS